MEYDMTISKNIRKKVSETYINNPELTQYDIGDMFGIGRDTVLKILREYNVPIRSYTGDRRMLLRKNYFDFSFFDNDTPTTAYWAGFFMADGSVSYGITGGVRLTCYVHPKDLGHMEKFREAIKLNKPIKSRKDGAVGFDLDWAGLKEPLARWGIIPNKTKKFLPPTIPNNLLPHYIRGWIDGDGTVYRYGRPRIVVASGNEPAMLWLREAIFQIGFGGHVAVKPLVNGKYNNFYLYIGGTLRVWRMCELLMVDSEYCLDRKWQGTRLD